MGKGTVLGKVITQVKMTPSMIITVKSDKKSKTDKALPSITALKHGEKLLLRPLPMHVESLAHSYREHAESSARNADEVIGAAIVHELTADIESYLPLGYCRLCDAVCNTIDVFYAHIQTPAHIEQKRNDSLPLFAELVEGAEPLTMNQLIAREFVSVALLQKEGEEVKIEGDMLKSFDVKTFVEFRLKRHPCAECSRIWEEYGSIIQACPDMAIEFAFRSHPLHPCVVVLNMILEIFKTKVVIESDMATKPSAFMARFPSKEMLIEISHELSSQISVTMGPSLRHSASCVENYQVALHCRAAEVRLIYAKFTEACEKRDKECRPFFCDVCRVSLPSSHCFLLHLLSEAHDKKMVKAPSRQFELYNPLFQMVCFIESTRLLAKRPEAKKEEKENENSKEEENEKKVVKSLSRKEKKKKKEVQMADEKNDDGKENKDGVKDDVTLTALFHPSPFMIDTRGFIARRPGYCVQKRREVMRVIRGIDPEMTADMKVIQV